MTLSVEKADLVQPVKSKIFLKFLRQGIMPCRIFVQKMLIFLLISDTM